MGPSDLRRGQEIRRCELPPGIVIWAYAICRSTLGTPPDSPKNMRVDPMPVCSWHPSADASRRAESTRLHSSSFERACMHTSNATGSSGGSKACQAASITT